MNERFPNKGKHSQTLIKIPGVVYVPLHCGKHILFFSHRLTTCDNRFMIMSDYCIMTIQTYDRYKYQHTAYGHTVVTQTHTHTNI